MWVGMKDTSAEKRNSDTSTLGNSKGRSDKRRSGVIIRGKLLSAAEIIPPD